jgi:hypothetical protein
MNGCEMKCGAGLEDWWEPSHREEIHHFVRSHNTSAALQIHHYGRLLLNTAMGEGGGGEG